MNVKNISIIRCRYTYVRYWIWIGSRNTLGSRYRRKESDLSHLSNINTDKVRDNVEHLVDKETCFPQALVETHAELKTNVSNTFTFAERTEHNSRWMLKSPCVWRMNTFTIIHHRYLNCCCIASKWPTFFIKTERTELKGLKMLQSSAEFKYTKSF